MVAELNDEKKNLRDATTGDVYAIVKRDPPKGFQFPLGSCSDASEPLPTTSLCSGADTWALK